MGGNTTRNNIVTEKYPGGLDRNFDRQNKVVSKCLRYGVGSISLMIGDQKKQNKKRLNHTGFRSNNYIIDFVRVGV